MENTDQQVEPRMKFDNIFTHGTNLGVRLSSNAVQLKEFQLLLGVTELNTEYIFFLNPK